MQADTNPSDAVKKGVERAPHRSLLRALGVTEWEMEQPFVGVVNSYSEVIPGHTHLRQIADAVKAIMGRCSGGRSRRRIWRAAS